MNKERYYHKLETIKESGNYRILREIEHNGFLIHDDGREMLNLSSNDYLGLSSNPRLIEEFREETDVMALPYSAVSSRLLSGNHPYYKMLEDDLADLYDKEAALVFNSGYHANIGILPALTNKRDLIVADKLVHASIIDGLRLSEAQMIRYKHLDYEHLRSILTQHREEYDNVFIVTESIFSMDGDTSDLQQLCEIKKEFDAFLSRHGCVFYKPLNLSCGWGIEKIDVATEPDRRALFDRLMQKGGGLIEEQIVQHPEMNRMFPGVMAFLFLILDVMH